MHAGTCAARVVLQGAALSRLRRRGWWLSASSAAGGARYQSLQRVRRTAGQRSGRPAAACSPARAAGPRGCRWGARWGAQSRTCCTNSSPLRWSQIMKVGLVHSARRAPCAKAARLSRRRRPPEEFAQNSVLLQERHLCSRNGSPRAATRPTWCAPDCMSGQPCCRHRIWTLTDRRRASTRARLCAWGLDPGSCRARDGGPRCRRDYHGAGARHDIYPRLIHVGRDAERDRLAARWRNRRPRPQRFEPQPER